jgi:hypothetical protein
MGSYHKIEGGATTGGTGMGHGDDKITTGGLHDKEGAWTASVKRGAQGDVGSYQANLVQSVNQRDRDSGVLTHGESKITTGGLHDKEGAWTASVKRGAKGDVGSFNPNETMSVNQGNSGDIGLTHGEHEITMGGMAGKEGAWTASVKRGAQGDVGSYNPNEAMSVNQGKSGDIGLKHGEDLIKTGSLGNKGSAGMARHKQSRFSIVGSTGSYHKVEGGHGPTHAIGLSHGDFHIDDAYDDETF